ncbi:unnamed protein product [Linum trigynum]|uniref:hAT-like transposase RNase-H fold domain-containing protein n=1 Tax=Linum trigynum TaxID=586398 RepID=A0AAV2ESF2_9ROSI
MRDMGNTMMSKFLKYWKDYNLVLAFCIILDPRYKLAFVKFCYEKLGEEYTSKPKAIMDDLELLFKEYKTQSQSVVHMASLSIPLDNHTAGFYASIINQNTSTRSELELYLADPLNPAYADIVASESSFSLGGRILSTWRTSISSDTLEAVVTTRNWMHGYKMDAEYDGEEVKLVA